MNPPPPLWQERAFAFVRRRRRLLFAMGVVCAGVAVTRPGRGADEGQADASLSVTLAEEGLDVDADSVVWMDEGGVVEPRGVVFLGRHGEAPQDVYYAEARVTGGGAVLDLGWLTNLTRSAGADDQHLVRVGHHVAYVSKVRGAYDAVTVLDLEGEPTQLTRDWSARAQLQNRLTNLQETGRWVGFGRRRYSLTEPSPTIELAARRETFVVRTRRGRVVLDPDRRLPIEGARLVDARPTAKAMPGTITWLVDTIRNLSFVGPEPIEWLEHRVFSVSDAVVRLRHALLGSTREAQEEAVADELGVTAAERRRRIDLSVTDPELGFPPPAMDTLYPRALEGEGQWLPVADDPFVRAFPNATTPFYTSFLRPDPERSFARIYVALWDPRLVQLRLGAGTREPESATGETGTGMVPRDPETLSRLVAGFNGGFQALHGEFGMMASGRVYLPPKPWAATVAVHRDGRVSIGSWPDPPPGVTDFEESWAVAQIPNDMVDFRQNLTSVVEGERYNPWERWWWGAAPLNAEEQVHIDRSGLCLTREGFLAYFWGRSLGPEALGEAMIRARCERGLHLDMNSRHTAFEFYDARPEGESRPPYEGRSGSKRYDGRMPFAPGWTLRSRLLVRSMSPMRFPRYAARDPRDFFYLTLKPVLPGPDLVLASGGTRRFETRGLPHAGFPYAFARLFVGDDVDSGTWLVRIDPTRAIHPAVIAGPTVRGSSPPLAYFTAAREHRSGTFGWFAETRLIGHRYAVGAVPEGGSLLIGGTPLTSTTDATAALGVDENGFAIYAERRASDPIPLSERLRQAGADRAVALPEGVHLAFAHEGTFVDVASYECTVDPDTAVPLLAPVAPAAEVLFPDTAPRPYSGWARMQDTRVRYFREGAPTFSQSAGGVRDEPDAGVE